MTGGRQTALITGATSGFGLEFARQFARDGYHLVIVARREEELARVKSELEASHGISVLSVSCDLAVPGAADQVIAQTDAAGVSVDVLVNNAGFGGLGHFHTTPAAHDVGMVQVNVTALVHLTKLYLPGMVNRGHGHVLNVASTAAFQPGPLQSVYYASKAFVLSFTEAIANELDGTGVGVTTLCAGPSRTGFQERAGTHHAYKGQRYLSPEEIVRQAISGFKRGKRVVTPGLMNAFLAFGTRFAPRSFSANVARKLAEKK